MTVKELIEELSKLPEDSVPLIEEQDGYGVSRYFPVTNVYPIHGGKNGADCIGYLLGNDD